MIFTPLIWKKHKRRPYENECPHCGAPLKWIYDGTEWLPCNKEPVLFATHPDGKLCIIYKKKELNNCILYAKGDPRTVGVPLWGHQQHYYTCPVLKAHRAEYIKRRYK